MVSDGFSRMRGGESENECIYSVLEEIPWLTS